MYESRCRGQTPKKRSINKRGRRARIKSRDQGPEIRIIHIPSVGTQRAVHVSLLVYETWGHGHIGTVSTATSYTGLPTTFVNNAATTRLVLD